MDEMPVRIGRYRHWKGELYDVLGIGIHTETNEHYVVYTDTDPGRPRRLYLRPLSHFLEPVDVELGAMERFVFLGDQHGPDARP